MALITDPVITNVGAEKMLRQYGGLSAQQAPTFFRVGEGGWSLTSQGTKVRRTPDPTLTDLDLRADIYRVDRRYLGAPDNGLSYFQKNITSIVYSAPRTLTITCTLGAGEYNTKADGFLVYPGSAPYGSPTCWEIGIFDADEALLLYGTMVQQTKIAGVPLTNTIRLVIP